MTTLDALKADMDGKGNTAKVLAVDNSKDTSWQTDSKYFIGKNVGDDQYVHPLFRAAWRYKTVGTSEGDWYIPSYGESYCLLMARNRINCTLDYLRDSTKKSYGNQIYSYGMYDYNITVASSEYDADNFTHVYMNNGKIIELFSPSISKKYRSPANNNWWNPFFIKLPT